MLLDRTTTLRTGGHPPADLTRLHLVCLVRSGDGYMLRAVAETTQTEDGGRRRHLDIAFGDAADRSRAAELDTAVRQVQRWCEDGGAVALVDRDGALALIAADGTEVTLPRGA